jgi:centrin-3
MPRRESEASNLSYSSVGTSLSTAVGRGLNSNISSSLRARHRRTKQELQDDQKKELKEAFDLFDVEKRGSVDYHELKVSKL